MKNKSVREVFELTDYVLYDELNTMNIMFERKDSHKYTRMAWNQRYTILYKKLADMVLDTSEFCGPEIEWDHFH
jgi:hypothetical protein